MSTGTRPPESTEDPSAQDLSGRTLGDFRILRKLGQGGMGQVYLAEQISLKRNVALKVLRPEMASSAQALARFKQEAEAIARVTHANIVQVYHFGQEEGVLFMVLEYVEGRNLKDFINKKGPPDLLIALSIMRQVASALQRAGELGIIHRDIKPENILLTRKGEVKVADFGLSRCLENNEKIGLNLTQTGVTMGTPLYMSPEQVEGKAVDPRTDIYSFGITAYHMLTGQPPFRGETAFEVAVAHVQKQPTQLATIRPDLPEGLCAIVHKMMQKDPAQRYQTGRDLLRDIVRLREGLSGQTSSAGPPPLPIDQTQLSRLSLSDQATTAAPKVLTPRWHWLSAAVALSLATALALGAFLAWWERRREGPLPINESVRPADASAVETILLPPKREQALRVLVDQALNVPADKTPDRASAGNCLQLGLLYLEGNRLDEADKLFSRLAQLKSPPELERLGKVGKAIVLALRNQPKESNKLFVEVFAPGPFTAALVGPSVKGKKDKLSGFAGVNGMARLEEKLLGPIRPILDDARARDMLARARQYNRSNGLPDTEVPRYLLWKFPVAESKPKK